MIIGLSKDLEKIVHDAVRAGLYAREVDVIRDALLRLRQTMPMDAEKSAKKGKPARTAKTKPKPLSPEELNQRLVAAGLVTRLPDPSQDIDDDDVPPVVIEGEPLSETIIRERR